jgi:hypothetical protein
MNGKSFLATFLQKAHLHRVYRAIRWAPFVLIAFHHIRDKSKQNVRQSVHAQIHLKVCLGGGGGFACLPRDAFIGAYHFVVSRHTVNNTTGFSSSDYCDVIIFKAARFIHAASVVISAAAAAAAAAAASMPMVYASPRLAASELRGWSRVLQDAIWRRRYAFCRRRYFADYDLRRQRSPGATSDEVSLAHLMAKNASAIYGLFQCPEALDTCVYAYFEVCFCANYQSVCDSGSVKIVEKCDRFTGALNAMYARICV